jgi:hypothetical protein
VAISQLCESHPFLSAKDIVAAYESQTTDCKTLQLQGLSVLELQLVTFKSIASTIICHNCYKVEAFYFIIAFADFVYLQLLSMKYLDKIYYGEPCNYEMAFYEYTKQMKTGSMQKFDRLIALKAMEHLEASFTFRCVSGSCHDSCFFILFLLDSGIDQTRRWYHFKNPERICCLQRSCHV